MVPGGRCRELESRRFDSSLGYMKLSVDGYRKPSSSAVELLAKTEMGSIPSMIPYILVA